jgi:putative mRNA 3-end processing factor
MRPEDILLPTPAGVYCKIGGFHIDPTRPVDKAMITHGHSDHARAGHGAVLATQETLDLMRLRYGETFDAAQVRLGHALSAHQPATLGQAARRGRPAGNTRTNAGKDRDRPRRDRSGESR